MDLLFLCGSCGRTKILPNPVSTKFKCECGGTLEMSLIRPSGRRTREITQANPNDEKTTLMDSLLEAKKPEKELSEDLYKFKVVMCPKCGWIQTTQAIKTMRCNKCNKTTQFRSRGRWNVKIRSFPTHEMACVHAKEWGMREGKNTKKL